MQSESCQVFVLKCKKTHQRRRRLCLTANSNYRAYYCSGSLKSCAHWDAKLHTRHGYCAGETESSLGLFFFTDSMLFCLTIFGANFITDAAAASQPLNDLPPRGDDKLNSTQISEAHRQNLHQNTQHSSWKHHHSHDIFTARNSDRYALILNKKASVFYNTVHLLCESLRLCKTR